MNNDFTHITMVVDRSGSMSSIRDDAEGGVNNFIEEQAKADGCCELTLYQFDDKVELVSEAVDAKTAPRYSLSPRGTTALYDAVGQAIAETGQYLSTLKEEDRPGLVIFVIVTDGQENASREYKAEQVKKMITEQTEKYAWQFTFLAANQDAFATGAAMGVARDSSLSFSGSQVDVAYMAASMNVKRMRSQVAAGASVCSSYTDDERKKAMGDSSDA